MDSPRFKPPLSVALASLHPPSPTHGDAAADPSPSWAILDFHAYVADRRNSTTAACKTSDGDAIQVTVFPAAPPRDRRRRRRRPRLLPRLRHVRGQVFYMYDYFIYQADGGNGEPLLELLPRPGRCLFFDEQAGILSRRRAGAGGAGAGYTVVALRDDRSAFHHGFSQPGHYDVCLLHSEDKVWTTTAVVVPPDQQQLQQRHGGGDDDKGGFRHNTSKVIAMGGEHGTMAFVDLYRGILQYDVLKGDPALRYITIPWHPDTDRKCILSTDHSGHSSRPRPLQEDSWHLDRELKSCDVKVGHNPQLLELLPKVPDNEGKTRVILGRLYTDHPLLSLHEDGLVYLMTKPKPRIEDKKAWLIAVDMGEGTLNGVADIAPGRPFFSGKCAYTQSQISKHLNLAPGGTQSGYVVTDLLVNDVEEYQIPSHTIDPTINEAHATTKSSQGRTKNFSDQEDILLVSAWLNVGMDPIQGFEIDAKNQSGSRVDDKIVDACALFKAEDKKHKRFTFMHCWNILKDKPKWTERRKVIGCAKKTSNKKQKTMANSSLASVEPAAPDVGGSEAQDTRRPDRKNKEKQKLWQGRYIEAVDYLMAKKKEADHEKELKKEERCKKAFALQEERINLEREKLEFERQKEEDRIMFLDLSTMTYEQQQYYEDRRSKILASLNI
ncbi:hypothetical protein ACP4OV_031445 [Aristida adscensionis]